MVMIRKSGSTQVTRADGRVICYPVLTPSFSQDILSMLAWYFLVMMHHIERTQC